MKLKVGKYYFNCDRESDPYLSDDPDFASDLSLPEIDEFKSHVENFPGEMLYVIGEEVWYPVNLDDIIAIENTEDSYFVSGESETPIFTVSSVYEKLSDTEKMIILVQVSEWCNEETRKLQVN